MGALGENEENPILPPLPEVEIQRPPGPPPDNMDGTVASGITTIAADCTAVPNIHVRLLLNQYQLQHFWRRHESFRSS